MRLTRPLLLFCHVLARLPLPFIYHLGALLGTLGYAFSSTYRRHLHTNMNQALGTSTTRSIRVAAIRAAGRMLLELPYLWFSPWEKTAAKIVEVTGWENVEAAEHAAQGILFLTPHLGCFDIIALYYAKHAKLTVLYRSPRKKWLAPIIIAGRSRPSLQLAAADRSGVRQLIKALKNREAVGILPDQTPRAGEGRWCHFFNRPAYTMTLAARLSETGASIIFAWGERLPAGAGYRIHFQAPKAPISGDLNSRLQSINTEIETLIRLNPEQYLWGYNRYKKPAGVESPPPSPIISPYKSS